MDMDLIVESIEFKKRMQQEETAPTSSSGSGWTLTAITSIGRGKYRSMMTIKNTRSFKE